MKKLFILLFVIFVISCDKDNDNIIKVGFVGEIHADIWNSIYVPLRSENIILEIVPFSDYTLLNKALNNGDIDLNAFQNYAYFVNDTNRNDYYLSVIEKTFIACMDIYSKNL